MKPMFVLSVIGFLWVLSCTDGFRTTPVTSLLLRVSSSRGRTSRRSSITSQPTSRGPWAFRRRGVGPEEGPSPRHNRARNDGGGKRAAGFFPRLMVSNAALTTAAVGSPLESSSKKRGVDWAAYVELLRPHNVPPAVGLVAFGAWVGSHDRAALFTTRVLLTALSSALVAMGSCILNDWFDVEVDAENNLERPLVSGRVKLRSALLLSLACLSGALLSAVVVSPVVLQGVIAASVLLVSLYTPFLKPVPVLKNLVAAGVIAFAITAGGLAAGATVGSTLAPAAVTFLGTIHREILMDVSDVEGDRQAGVRTLPVLLGRPAAVVLAVGAVTASMAIAARDITAAALVPKAVGHAKQLACLAVAGTPLFINALRVAKNGYQKKDISRAVDWAFGPLVLILALLGIVRGGT